MLKVARWCVPHIMQSATFNLEVLFKHRSKKYIYAIYAYRTFYKLCTRLDAFSHLGWKTY